jgi:capsular polysaccharide transport system permease protein
MKSQNPYSLIVSMTVQRRVLGALLMREVLTRYGRHNIGFLWLFVEPMLFTLGVTALWTATQASHGSSLPIVAFAVTGYSSVLLWRNMPSRCIGAIEPNLALMYHRNVKVLDIYVARLLLEAIGATISFFFLTIFFAAIGWMKLPEDVSKVLLGWVMLAWFGGSLALLLGALSERSELVEKLWFPTSYLLFPLSGAAFMVDALPPAAQSFVLLLPMVHGVELLREGYFGSSFTAHYDLVYMASICLALNLFGLVQTRFISKRVMPG